jgi:hypothetical protein
MGKRQQIDPGVNFFVLALGHFGAMTLFSCEGHPGGFYIVFRSTEKLARRVHSCGFFSVELERGTREYSLRLRDVDILADRKRDVVLWTEASKAKVLRWASAAWWKDLGPFPLPRRSVVVKSPDFGGRIAHSPIN